jgi:hypothetical protein
MRFMFSVFAGRSYDRAVLAYAKLASVALANLNAELKEKEEELRGKK